MGRMEVYIEGFKCNQSITLKSFFAYFLFFFAWFDAKGLFTIVFERSNRGDDNE